MKNHNTNNTGLRPEPRRSRLVQGYARQAGTSQHSRHPRKHSVRTVGKRNYAFIDSQNVNRSVRAQGWNLDWKEFRRYLQTQQDVTKALLFIGFIEGNQPLYDELNKAGFTVIFKPTVEIKKDGEITVKGNIDTDLVLHAMIEHDNYDRAVIVSGDGDFYGLAEHLDQEGKLKTLLVPSSRRYSTLLKEFQPHIVGMDTLRASLER